MSAWRVALEARGLGAISINVRITAARKLAVEAADNGLLSPELAAGITRVKGVRAKGVPVVMLAHHQGAISATPTCALPGGGPWPLTIPALLSTKIGALKPNSAIEAQSPRRAPANASAHGWRAGGLAVGRRWNHV